MRTAVLFGLTFIGDNIGRAIDADGGTVDVTAFFIILLLFCVLQDAVEMRQRCESV